MDRTLSARGVPRGPVGENLAEGKPIEASSAVRSTGDREPSSVRPWSMEWSEPRAGLDPPGLAARAGWVVPCLARA
ncbi:hypothetical protein SAMN05421810_101843 [Amycolatopsis arida]|uniref:Uncharacterized protein n=1 Tax=Amycolatopsis arida TaxID=587909 RepID=A0A1I5M9E8_9PSEU|nr:hypothetical protein CLV69_104475 [Amycolatopsis arida]SFP06165.1 hypothetical protein SAMN05421810_101843 [Amycolatopsis arida]